MRSAILSAVLCGACVAASAAEATYQEAVELVKESETDRSKVVPAARALAILAEETQDPHINSMLYWVKKRMTVKEAQHFASVDPHAEKISHQIVNKKVEKTEAAKYLEAAEDFASMNSDPLLKAIRYYEVASRFIGTEESLIAQERSLGFMREVQSATRLPEKKSFYTTPKVKPVVARGYTLVSVNTNGYFVYVDGKPAIATNYGVAITPCDIMVPPGRRVFTFVKPGYRDMTKRLNVDMSKKGMSIDLTSFRATPGRSRVISYIQSMRATCQKSNTKEGVQLTDSRDKKFILSRERATVPFRFTVIAQSDGRNIRFKVMNGQAIFNWECDPQQLRIRDPKGSIFPIHGEGVIQGYSYERIDIVVKKTSMLVYVNGELRGECRGDYSGLYGTVGVGPAWGSVVKVHYMGISRDLSWPHK